MEWSDGVDWVVIINNNNYLRYGVSVRHIVSEAMKGNSNMLGKKHSEEAKIKMREARKNRISKILELVKTV